MQLFLVLRLSAGRIDPISYINTTVQAFGLHCFCILLYCGGPPLLDIRVCTPKKTRTMSCRQSACDETSLYGMPWPLYSTAVFNLNAFVVYWFCSLSFMYFGRAKVHKAPGTRKKQSFAPFAYELRCNITRPSQTCHSNPICLEQGVAKLVPHGCIRKLHPCCIQTFSHNGLLKTGIYVVFLSMPVFF